jgi:ribonuclease HII
MPKLLLSYKTNLIEAGCDEAGRGCLAGPVFAAAVILPHNFKCKELNDSKKLSEKQREGLRIIIEREAMAWAVASISNVEIDKINILNASIKAMHVALEKLKIQPDYIIVDGNRFKPFKKVPHSCIIKGDGKYMNIAAASILAKTHRDEFMLKQHLKFSQFSWNKNKGYPTKVHRDAIAVYGTSPLHRMSFRLLDESQLKFNL